ncbi:MAG: OsmC family peroxiredoxin [Proteobacteria bacterium]|nr:MAG: OsmC family peroxiredoxin [Pseudomonadota bacterium]
MDRKATSIWTGSIKEGQGTITSDSGALQNQPYSFTTRFEGEKGTNPEELIAAAHSACFAMATSGNLSKAGFNPTRLQVTATVTVSKKGEGWEVGSSKLQLSAQIPEISEAKFQELAQDAKANCPISKLLRAEITLDAKLETMKRAGEPGM